MVSEIEERESTRRIALELLEVRDRSVKEIRERLRRRGCAPAAIDKVVGDLEALRLLDDHAFVRRWVDSRRSRRPEGVPKIALDLARRGIEPAVVEEVLAEYGDDLGTGREALSLLLRQRSRYWGLDRETARRRMYGLLARRGFDADTAREAVDRAWSEIERARGKR